MIRASQIPDEVVEAARYAFHNATGPTVADDWRASLAAALSAWQTPEHKAFVGSALDDVYGFFPALILPLPKGVSDE